MKKPLFTVFVFLFLTIFLLPVYAEQPSFSIKNHRYEEKESSLAIQIDYPIFSGFESALELNQKIYSLLEQRITEIKKIYGTNSTKQTIQFHSLYDYFKNDEILSLWIENDSYTGGAHGNSTLNSFTINLKSGEFYQNFSDLFQENSNYARIMTARITTKMKENPDSYFENATEILTEKGGKFPFYLDGNEIVVYFDTYELAPYSSGRITFRFSAEELEELLKPEIYHSIQGETPLKNVRINGTNGTLDPTFYIENFNAMLPLHSTASILGYEIKWDPEKGPILNGRYVNRITKTVTKETILYVPLSYFTDILQESIYFEPDLTSKGTLKIFVPEILDQGTFSYTNP